MRNYELAYIADPELDDEQLTALHERVQALIEGAEGKLVNVDRWGKRKMAYPIDKHADGYYVIVQAQLPPSAGSSIERDLRLNEQILRFLITRMEGEAPA